MSMNNSYSYQYRTENNFEGGRSTYTTPQYDDVVKKYANYDPSQQRSTLGVSQGINQSNFSKSVSYQPTNTGSIGGGYGYSTVTYNNSYNPNGQPDIYQDKFSGIKNVQIKEVQSPEKNLYGQYDFQEEQDRVKKSKKNQEVTITKSTLTQEGGNYGVTDYQPVFVGYQNQSNNTFIKDGTSTNSQIIILDNPDITLQNRSSVNYRLEYQNKSESKSIQDQNITLCNIF